MPETNYTASEMMVVAASRMLQDGAVVFIGIGLPSLAGASLMCYGIKMWSPSFVLVLVLVLVLDLCRSTNADEECHAHEQDHM